MLGPCSRRGWRGSAGPCRAGRTSLLHLYCHELQAPAPGSLSPQPAPQLPSALRLPWASHCLPLERDTDAGPASPQVAAGDQHECSLQRDRAWAGVSRSPPPFSPPISPAGPLLSLSEQEGAGVPQADGRHKGRGAWERGPQGRPGHPSPPRGCKQRGRCSGAEPVQDASAESKAPPGGAPRPRPYLWPTSLPTEPPPRAGSSGLSPCGSSGAEAPAGVPPGPALPSDGERGSLARAILPERTAAAAGGGGGTGATISARLPALPAPPPQWNGRGGAGMLEGGRAPSRLDRGRPGSAPSPSPELRGRLTWERGVSAPRAARGLPSHGRSSNSHAGPHGAGGGEGE